MDCIECSIGVMAYNEAGTIAASLESVLSQQTRSVRIREIIVVASGCDDGTVGIVRGYAPRDPRLRLLVQERREGKMSAINLFLRHARYPVSVLANADLILRGDFIERLVSPFRDGVVGMTGGHVVPLDPRDDLMGYAAHFLWEFHHRIAMDTPKLGEAVAYRLPSGFQFAGDTVDDEGGAEAAVTARGLQLRYVPEAVCYNKNPRTVAEFISRRRNIYAGHLQLRARASYCVSTFGWRRIICALPGVIRACGRRSLPRAAAVILMEIWARLLGFCDFYVFKRDHSVWKVALTSKRVLTAREKDGAWYC